MLDERIRMCARKGFDAVELDDIDGFDPPSTTGFHLTPG
jgi:Glycoside-hydrolase family GH114